MRIKITKLIILVKRFKNANSTSQISDFYNYYKNFLRKKRN